MTETKKCPQCGAQMKPASYGMLPPDEETRGKYYDMGCFMDEIRATFGCPECNLVIYPAEENPDPFKDL